MNENIIHILPDSISNQIAAGEVIQRPASVVKELVENAIDAKASIIQIIIKEAGRSLIQVIDNGSGMSAIDARLSFERHATSKICNFQDLFSLRSMGFRGEALASISAVSHVELKTRLKNEEIGTLIQVSASHVEKEETIVTNVGSSFSVKNLFYNIPVRRKFLKSNETEFKNILTELERASLVNPHISFSLFHNNIEIVSLPISNIKQRIIRSAGKKFAQNLLPVDVKTSFIRIYGFVGSPSSSKRRGALQFFFANGRYMRHAYFHRAITKAFEPFLLVGEQPNYFLYMEIDPANIDVNIHPSKTEIKFENEPMLFQVLLSVTREALAIPTLEFDQEESIDIPVYIKNTTETAIPPSTSVIQKYSNYNFFEKANLYNHSQRDLEKILLKKTFKKEDLEKISFEKMKNTCLQHKGKYLILSLKSGLAVVDQRRAHIRILFDEYLNQINQKQGFSQKLIFSKKISFSSEKISILKHILDDLTFIGFEFVNSGNHTYFINGIPSGWEKFDIVATILEIVDTVLISKYRIENNITKTLILTIAYKMAIPYGKGLSEEDSLLIIGRLFSSPSPYCTPDGKRIIYTYSEEELNKKFI